MVNKKRVSKVLVFVLLIGTLLSSVAFAADTKDYVIDKDIKISAKAHIQSFGDRSFETDDKGVLEFGTTGKAKRLEEFALKLEGAPKDMAIEYRVHGQSYGDMPAEADKWIRGDKEIGSRGKAKRIEGIQIRLVNTETGKAYEGYSVEYQVHMQSFGWGVNKTDKGDVWAKDGEFAGTKGLSKRLEAVRVRIKKEDVLKIKAVESVDKKTLKVVFNKPVKDADKVQFSAKRDSVPLTFAKVTWNDAKTEANLEVSYKLFTGKYVVSAKVGDDTLTSPEVVVEESKVAAIVFTSDKAIIGKANTRIYPNVKIESQYGENLINDPVFTGGLTMVSSKGTAKIENGKFVVEASNEFKIGEKVVVSIIHPASNASASATVECVAAPNIAAIELGDVTTKDGKKDIYVGTNLDKGEYWIPLNVVDQYGNLITDADILDADLTKISSNATILDMKDVKIVSKDGKPVLMLKGSPKAAGYVNISVVSKSGKIASKLIEVKDSAKLDVMTLIHPNIIVKAGEEFTLPFEAYNQYGTKLEKAEGALSFASEAYTNTLTLGPDSAKTTISVTNGMIKPTRDYTKDGKLVLKVKPNENAAGQKLMFTVITPTGKYSNLVLDIQAAGVAKTIAGVNTEELYTAMQVGTTQTFKLNDHIIFRDQYGDEITPSADQVDFKVETDDQKIKYTTTEAASFEAVSPGVAKCTVTLKDGDKILDVYTFNMEAVALKDIANFEINDVKTLYTGDNYRTNNGATDYDRIFTISGKKSDGTKVLIKEDLIKGATITTPLKLDTDDLTKVKLSNESNKVETGGAEKKATATFTIEGADKPVVITKEVTYSNARPVAKSLVAKQGEDVVTNGVAFVAQSDLDGTKAPIEFIAKDQYDVALKDISYAITGVKHGANVNIDSDGKINATGLTSGDSFTITAMIDGLSVNVKITIK